MTNRSSDRDPPTPPTGVSDFTKSSDRAAPTPGTSTTQDARAFTPGTLLANRYRIVALLGRGGMGEIYRAEDTKLGHPVALKFMRGTLSPEILQRFYAEVRIGRQVSHANVCRLYDVVEHEGDTFLTMEYVDGEDLGSLLARIGRLAPDKALELARNLCAGLAAVHDKGVVHRDLKPANVMVDGRGQARLTDFGLALSFESAAAAGFGGTPIYMSPEQLEGKAPTPRSDIYTLGLVLYEMFTGRRFFEGRTLGEIRSQHKEPKSGRLASIARLIEPQVEHVLLQCLEEDPAARPASARSVLALLPGGDPLEAAVAAGETPSPELVAAASRTGEMSAGAAWACLLGVVAGISAVAFCFDQTGLMNRKTLPRTPEWLAVRAHDVLAHLGHPEPADLAYAFELDRDLLAYTQQGPWADRWKALTESRLSPFYFFYRQSPGKLVARNRDGTVQQDDPPRDVSGMAEVFLDHQGRLLGYTSVPPQVDRSPGPWPEPDFSPLLREAGLDSERLETVRSEWTAPVDTDRKVAWTGFAPGDPTLPIRVEAAAFHGRPVWFRLLHPWSEPERMAATAAPVSRIPVGDVGVGILALALPIGGVILARRNLRLGRGDRKGAFRVAVFVAVAYTAARVVRADHVARFADELWIVIKLVAYPVFWGVLVWLVYMALEPYARRRWPHMLISWKRLLTGGFDDPLVGRDVLLGCVVGALALVFFLGAIFGPTWMGKAPPPPPPFSLGDTLTSVREAGFRVFVNQFSAVLFGLVFLFMLVLLRLILRSTVLAMVLWCVLVGSPLSWLDFAHAAFFGLARALLMLFALLRGGLLSLVVALFVMFSLLEVPLTLDLSAWFAMRALPVLLVVLGLSVYGFKTALAGKPLFGRELLDD
jgi:eukaryotic-like serine/threonine-protein kinase